MNLPERQIIGLRWPLSILFQVITGFKSVWMLRISTYFNTISVAQSVVIVIQCLLQGLGERRRVM